MNRLHIHLRSLRPRHRRGAIFIIALAVIIVLSGLVLVFAQEMRTEAMSSANRLSYAQADAVEQGAEQWVLAQVESNAPDSVTITQTTDAEAIQVGGGYFWLLSPDPTQDQTYAFGITDEAGKLNLSTASNSLMQFQNLPGMTADIVSSIIDWESATDTADPNGAGNSYYQGLQEPYACKGAAFESVEELLLIRNMTPQILYGIDLNHDGVIDTNEQNIGGLGATLSAGVGGGTDTRGLFNYVTFVPPPVVATPPATTGLGGTSSSTTPQIVNVSTLNTQGYNALQSMLSSFLGSGKASTIIANLNSRGGRGQPPPPLLTLQAFYQASQMQPADFGTVFNYLTSAAAATSARLNVLTASEQALMCLPGLQQGDADTIVSARTNADQTNMSWFFTTVQSSQVGNLADWVTDQSYQYSADIVAVSGDGRSFKRVRIVVDASGYPTTPAKIIYRKDLTGLGWPLPPEVREALRAGQPPPDSTQTDSLGLGSSGLKLGTSPK